MKLVIDMNLSPQWVPWLQDQGYAAVHWSEIGSPKAPDSEILTWARENGHIVFTHDLDFSRLLAMTHSSGPSVFQVRTEDVLPSAIGNLVVRVLRQHSDSLREGAIVILEAESSRARILPI
jgi:predicted nuclease of predicted toxin-antitoxin system